MEKGKNRADEEEEEDASAIKRHGDREKAVDRGIWASEGKGLPHARGGWSERNRRTERKRKETKKKKKKASDRSNTGASPLAASCLSRN